MTIEVVFFDAGETLLHPHPSFPELFTRVASENGYPLTVERVHEVQQRLAPHLVELAEETGIDKPSLDPDDSLVFWSHLYRRLLAELGIEDEPLVGEMYATFSSSASYRLFDDALPALKELEGAGYRLGLISNFEQWLEEMLVELEVGHIFETSVISGMVGLEKPDPEIYRRALERADVAPEAAVHIGDSPKMDVEPARSIGMRTILLDRYDRYMDADGPRVGSLMEVATLLHRL
jgi:putative hydrolase of the HAD superfamily